MMDPERLEARDSTPFEYRLLSAARNESIPHEMKLRMGQGLPLGAATITSGTAAGLSLKLVTLVVLGVAGIAGVVGFVLKQGDTSPAPRPPSAIAEPAPTTPAALPAVVAEPAEAPTETSMPAPSAPGAKRTAARASGGDSTATRGRDVDLREEIALIDDARAAIAAGAPGKALGVLGRHDRRYPNGVFAPEATVLRIEALTGAGEGEMARTLAHRFLKAHPDSPFAERVERLAGTNR